MNRNIIRTLFRRPVRVTEYVTLQFKGDYKSRGTSWRQFKRPLFSIMFGFLLVLKERRDKSSWQCNILDLPSLLPVPAPFSLSSPFLPSPLRLLCPTLPLLFRPLLPLPLLIFLVLFLSLPLHISLSFPSFSPFRPLLFSLPLSTSRSFSLSLPVSPSSLFPPPSSLLPHAVSFFLFPDVWSEKCSVDCRHSGVRAINEVTSVGLEKTNNLISWIFRFKG